jgi:UDP-N-acetylbacillosamine N-acetyltransferase
VRDPSGAAVPKAERVSCAPMKNLVIYGAGGHAKVVAEIARLNGWNVVGFIDGVDRTRKGTSFYGSTILGGDEVLPGLLDSGVNYVLVGFGANRPRLEVARRLLGMGFRLATAIHPSAVCATDTLIGEGAVLCCGAVAGPSSRIGGNVIINTKASIDHDCAVHDGAHVGPGAVVAGSVQVCECAWVGAGAVIGDHKSIGADSVVGAGAVVVKDVPPGVVVVGVPARIMRNISE